MDMELINTGVDVWFGAASLSTNTGRICKEEQ